MCSTCTTAIDTLGWNTAIGVAFASEGVRRLRHRLAGGRVVERQMADWDADAEFVKSVGLDPLEVLGAPPLVPDPAAPTVEHPVDAT